VNNLTSLLESIDHGTLSDLIGDARVAELLFEISKSSSDAIDRGDLVLSLLGGVEKFLTDSGKRRTFFMSLNKTKQGEIKKYLEVNDLYSFRNNEKNLKKLFEYFDYEYEEEKTIEKKLKVDLIKPQYGLFPHQTTALLECLKILESSSSKVMLHMPTGSGKTRTAMHLIARHLNRNQESIVIWIVSGRELCEQASDELETSWSILGEREVPLIRLWADTHGMNKEVKNSDSFNGSIWPEDLEDAVIVASVDSLRNLVNQWEPGERVKRRRKIGLIVFDEAHQSVATTYLQTLEMITESDTSLLGLSATPGRRHFGADNIEDKKLVDLFSGNKVELKINGYSSPVEALIDQGYLAKLEKEQLKISNSSLNSQDLTKIKNEINESFEISSNLLKIIGLDALRNLQIAERIISLVKDENHLRVILFAPSVESSEVINNILMAKGLTSYSVTNMTPSNSRAKAIQDFKSDSSEPVVLCNFGVLTTGFDAPRTSAAVIARPTLSIVLLNQMAGRAIRGEKVGGNKIARLVTVVDTAIPQLVNTVEQFHAFDNSWKEGK